MKKKNKIVGILSCLLLMGMVMKVLAYNCNMKPSGSIPELGDSGSCPNNCNDFITSGPNGNLFCTSSSGGSCDDSTNCANYTIWDYQGTCSLKGSAGDCMPVLTSYTTSTMYRCVKESHDCGG
jgi:hypothetical protein